MAKKTQTAQGWLDGLDDPDMVGQSEYRIIHELLTELDLSEEATEQDKLKYLQTVIEEIETQAAGVKASLQALLKPLPGKKRKFMVEISRSCPQYLSIEVKAKNEAEAKELALAKAGDHDFGSGTTGSEADYRVEGVKEK